MRSQCSQIGSILPPCFVLEDSSTPGQRRHQKKKKGAVKKTLAMPQHPEARREERHHHRSHQECPTVLLGDSDVISSLHRHLHPATWVETLPGISSDFSTSRRRLLNAAILWESHLRETWVPWSNPTSLRTVTQKLLLELFVFTEKYWQGLIQGPTDVPFEESVIVWARVPRCPPLCLSPVRDSFLHTLICILCLLNDISA